MSDHKFSLGEVVRFEGGSKQLRTLGQYEVVRQLPAVGNDYQYRLKHVADGHERIARECLLIVLDEQEPVAAFG